MLKTPLLAISTLALLTASVAQGVTSPKGLDSTEGNAFFFASTNRRYQSIDNTHKGSVLSIKSFHMRRDKSRTSRSGASTVDFTLDMGEADMSVVCSDFDCNYLRGTRKNVFPRMNVSWPDWGAASPTPAPFDFGVTLNAPFLHLGINALVWDLTLQNGTNSGNIFDRDYTFYTSGSGTTLGPGCSGFNLNTQMQSNGPGGGNYGMRFRAYCTNAPPSTAIGWSLALTDSNLTIPGFCAKVHALPLLVLPLGMSNSTGRVGALYYQTAYSASLNGLTLVSQAFGDNSGSIALSNGQSATMPTNPATTGHEACYLWKSLTRSTNFVFYGGSILARLGT